jgi:hypothetical protein
VNGSEGILHAVDMRHVYLGSTHKYAAVAIVEFPECHGSVHLDGLPPRHYPIYPESCTIHVRVLAAGRPEMLTVQRHQLALQLAFARTAHGAQGKTLPAVASDLNFGGAKAYVIASRATDRHGLALLQSVTLEHLNKPPDRDLRVEHMRQKALEHNTLLNFGFMSGRPATVPDPESRLALTDPTGNVKLTWESERPNAHRELKVSRRTNLKRDKPDSVDDDGADSMSIWLQAAYDTEQAFC